MDVRVGKYCFNSDSPDLENKESFKKAFPDVKADIKKKIVGFDSSGFWKAYQLEKKRLDALKEAKEK